jgi:hypothetical protein
MNKPRFEFYERVLVKTGNPEKAQVDGQTGAVLGRTETEEKDGWIYAVALDTEQETWSFSEGELESLGQFSSRGDFYDGSTARVRVDKNGEGRIVDDDR